MDRKKLFVFVLGMMVRITIGDAMHQDQFLEVVSKETGWDQLKNSLKNKIVDYVACNEIESWGNFSQVCKENRARMKAKEKNFSHFAVIKKLYGQNKINQILIKFYIGLNAIAEKNLEFQNLRRFEKDLNDFFIESADIHSKRPYRQQYLDLSIDLCKKKAVQIEDQIEIIQDKKQKKLNKEAFAVFLTYTTTVRENLEKLQSILEWLNQFEITLLEPKFDSHGIYTAYYGWLKFTVESRTLKLDATLLAFINQLTDTYKNIQNEAEFVVKAVDDCQKCHPMKFKLYNQMTAHMLLTNREYAKRNIPKGYHVHNFLFNVYMLEKIQKQIIMWASRVKNTV